MSRVTSSSSSNGPLSIQDTAGNPLTSTSGALNVNVTSAPTTNVNLVAVYNEVTNVASGIETVVATYTSNDLATCFLNRILTSGTNCAEYKLYKNTTVIDKRYSSFTNFNTFFEFIAGDNGLKLISGDVVYLKVIHSRPYVGNFNSNIIVTEVT